MACLVVNRNDTMRETIRTAFINCLQMFDAR